MSSFTKPLKVVLLDDGIHWELLEDFVYYLEDNKDYIIKVPKGYRTDFASIPTLFWSFLRHRDIYNKASVIHDYLCDTDGDNGRFNKRKVDSIFYEAQCVLKIPCWKASIFYWFAQQFGTIDKFDYRTKGEK